MTPAQGWQCPVCHTIYNPAVTECHRCHPATFWPITIPGVEYVPYVAPVTYISPTPCLFDNLPEGSYGLYCPCPKHGSYCGTTITTTTCTIC